MATSILDFFKAVLAFFEKEAPIAATIMAAIPGMQVPAAGTVLLSQIPSLCQAAEALLGAGKGDDKYDLVLTMSNAALIALQKIYPAESTKYQQLAVAIPTAIEQTIANVKIAAMAAVPAPAAIN